MALAQAISPLTIESQSSDASDTKIAAEVDELTESLTAVPDPTSIQPASEPPTTVSIYASTVNLYNASRNGEVVELAYCKTKKYFRRQGRSSMTLPLNTAVIVTHKSENGWSYAYRKDGFQGWVPSDFLECLDKPISPSDVQRVTAAASTDSRMAPYLPPAPYASYNDWYGDFQKDLLQFGSCTDWPPGHTTWLHKSHSKARSHSHSGLLRRKIVMVGDGACGKTCTLVTFSKGSFPEVYVPTVFENYVADVEVDSSHLELALWDTAGQEDYDRLRPLSYPDSHAIVISFAIDSPASLSNVYEKWISEVVHFCEGIPVILSGFKHDLKDDPRSVEELSYEDQTPTSYAQGLAVAKMIGASAYVECSARLGTGIRGLFEAVSRVALTARQIDRSAKGKHKEAAACNLM